MPSNLRVLEQPLVNLRLRVGFLVLPHLRSVQQQVRHLRQVHLASLNSKLDSEPLLIKTHPLAYLAVKIRRPNLLVAVLGPLNPPQPRPEPLSGLEPQIPVLPLAQPPNKNLPVLSGLARPTRLLQPRLVLANLNKLVLLEAFLAKMPRRNQVSVLVPEQHQQLQLLVLHLLAQGKNIMVFLTTN